jgi:hypothetical protein
MCMWGTHCLILVMSLSLMNLLMSLYLVIDCLGVCHIEPLVEQRILYKWNTDEGYT